MRWYDIFSLFYDSSLEKLYLPQRQAAAEALDLAPGLSLLDCPCGTGQSFDVVRAGVMPGGTILGVDRSKGMLGRARKRIDRKQLTGVEPRFGEIGDLDAADVAPESVDRLLVFLGMTVLPDMEAGFEDLWKRLRPGGRCVLVDCYNPAPGLQGISVKYIAQADITKQWWLPLERRGEQFERRGLPSKPEHGGEIILATALKPA